MAAEGNHDAFKDEYEAFMKDLNVIANRLAPIVTRLQEQAAGFTRTAQMIAVKRVDDDTVSETQEVAKILGQLQGDCDSVSSGTHDAVKLTQAALDQLKTTHDGIQEAMRRSPVNDRVLADLDPSWVTPE